MDTITPPARVISTEVQNDQEHHVNKRGILYKWLACRPMDTIDMILITLNFSQIRLKQKMQTVLCLSHQMLQNK